MSIYACNDVAKKMNSTQKLMLKAGVKDLNSLGWESDKLIARAGTYLSKGKLGEIIYEGLLQTFDQKESLLNSLVNLYMEYTETVKIYDFITSFREILTDLNNEATRGNTEPKHGELMFLAHVYASIIKAYNLGSPVAVNTKKEEVYLYTGSSVLDIHLYGGSLLGKSYPYGLSLKTINRDTKGEMKNQFAQAISTLNKKQHLLFLNLNMMYTFKACMLLIFNEVDEVIEPTGSVYHRMLELVVLDKQLDAGSDNYSLMLSFLSVYTTPVALTLRKFYVRDKGVVVVFEKPLYGNVERIFFREVHVEGEIPLHQLTVIYETTNGVRHFLPLSMTNLKGEMAFTTGNHDLRIILFTLYWLEILTDDFVDMMEYGVVVDISNDVVDLKELTVNTVNQIKNTKYYYEQPSQWNYDYDSASGVTKATSYGKVDRITTVGRYTRKLPVGQVASASALSLAKKYHIKLEEGYTLVDEFERVNKINTSSVFK